MKVLKRKENKKNKDTKSSKKTFNFLKKENTYTNKDIFIVTLSSIVFGFVFCLFVLMFITGGKNVFTLCIDLKDFVKSYNALTNRYYGEVDKQDLIDAAIKGMYSSVDDEFTTYLDQDTSSTFEETVEGKYEGIGCSVITDTDGNIIVYNIFEDSPAEEAGLQEDDIITAIDGVDYTDKTSSDVSEYIKTSTNSKFVLTIKRDNETLDITVNRKTVEIQTVTSKIYEENEKQIGYIQISTFSSVTKSQLEEKLKELEKQNIDSLIIDVRNNGGGYLDSVTDIADLFLKKGKVIYQLETTTGTKKIKSTSKTSRTYPIAILVNKSSASASEILAAAIKESYGGYVIGTNTYGKGTVQETMTMSDGSIIKYTTKNWLTPNGNWINEVGLEPTEEVELSDDYYDNPTDDNDTQLQKALEVLSK
jgi:carboxyl-terminal processing protease